MSKAVKRMALEQIDKELARAHEELGRMLNAPSAVTEYKLQEFKGMIELRDRLKANL